MKAQPLIETADGYSPCEPSEATHLRIELRGPLPTRILPVMIKGTREGTGKWTWNGSVDSPTLRPSILTRGGDENGEHRCHTFIKDGKSQFLSDCSHEFANQTLDLLDID